MNEKLVGWFEELLPEIRRTNDVSGTMLKFANEKNLAPALLEKLGHVYNTAKTVTYLDKCASEKKERGESFGVLDVPELITSYKSKKANEHDYGDNDFSSLSSGSFTDLFDGKVSFEDLENLDKSEDYQEIKIASDQRSSWKSDSIKLANADQAEQLIFDSKEDTRKLASDISDFIRDSYNETSYADVESDAKYYFGDCVKSACDYLASYMNGIGYSVERAEDAGKSRLLEDTTLLTKLAAIQDNLNNQENAAAYIADTAPKKKQASSQKAMSDFLEGEDVDTQQAIDYARTSPGGSKGRDLVEKQKEHERKEEERYRKEVEYQRGEAARPEKERREQEKHDRGETDYKRKEETHQREEAARPEKERREQEKHDRGEKQYRRSEKERKQQQKDLKQQKREQGELDALLPEQVIDYAAEPSRVEVEDTGSLIEDFVDAGGNAAGVAAESLGEIGGRAKKTLGMDKSIPETLSALRGGATSFINEIAPGRDTGQELIDRELDEAKYTSILQDLIITDPILSEEDEDKVTDLYNTIKSVAPELSKDKNVVRVVLRSAVQYDGIAAPDLAQLVEAEKSLQKSKWNNDIIQSQSYAKNPRDRLAP